MNVETSVKSPKDKKLRHAEYYGMTDILDDLFSKATKKQNFNNLMNIITSRENILLSYRNIKRNKGSKTSACDNINIEQIEKMEQECFIREVMKRFHNYQPKKVRRKEIPKPNGKTRPLGIPSMWDRIIQQCILQVLEPICEAHFCNRSYGFRPNRSAEHAIADAVYKVNQQSLRFVVDVDIKSFFDEVNHTKLMRQLWTLGIRDKQLLVILRKILKAPIQMQNGETVFPTKGTPQGGILSPLLANIYLNEFDWWISNQWETFHDLKEIRPKFNNKGTRHKGNEYTKMRKTKLKEMYIVRYADDFKIFTNSKNNAEKIFKACEKWLTDRLKLQVSKEKSQITNLKKHESEFLGFAIRAKKKSKKKDGSTKYIAETHISQKAKTKLKSDLNNQIKKIQKSQNSMETIKGINRYNSMIIGKHNYFRVATHINKDLKHFQISLYLRMYNRFPKASRKGIKNSNGLTFFGHYEGKDKGIIPYLKSKQTMFLMKRPIISASYVQHRNPMMKKKGENKYTPDGRKNIHSKLKGTTEGELKWLRGNPVLGRATVEFNDNRISLYVAQKGNCSITGEYMFPWDMHCHHKKLWSETKDDSYKNLTLVKPEVHRLIHATKESTINELLSTLRLNEHALQKLNKLRGMIGNPKICIAQ